MNNYKLINRPCTCNMPISNETINRMFSQLITSSNLRNVTFYSLRGAGTTQKLRNTSNPKLVQADMGGDSEGVMMKHYAQAEDKDRRDLAAKMNEKFFSKINRKDKK